MDFSKLENVKIWLKDLLSEGPMLAEEIISLAKRMKIVVTGANSVFYRAKDELGIKSQQTHMGGNQHWWWFDLELKMTNEMRAQWLADNKEYVQKQFDNDPDTFLETDEEDEDTDKDTWIVYNKNQNGSMSQSEHYANIYQQTLDSPNFITKEVVKNRKEDKKEATEHKKYYNKYYGHSY